MFFGLFSALRTAFDLRQAPFYGYALRPGVTFTYLGLKTDETAAVLRDGWFLTGDLAALDAEGWFRIAGRKKEMIVVGGYKVYPDDVDRVLHAHPDVAESATIGVPHPRLGETVKSFVVLKPGAAADGAPDPSHA